MPDGIRDVALRTRNRVAQRSSQRQMRRNRGGKRAPRTVRVATEYAWMTELDELAVLEQEVHDVVAWVVAAFNQHRSGTHSCNASRRLAPILVAVYAHPAQRFRLRDIGRDEKGLTEQLGLETADGLLIDQPVAALRDHHRVNDKEGDVEVLDRRGDGFDDRRIGEHSRLDGVR